MEFLESHDDTLGQVRTSACSCYEISTEVYTMGSQVFFCLNITWVCVLVSGKCEQEGVLDNLKKNTFPGLSGTDCTFAILLEVSGWVGLRQ